MLFQCEIRKDKRSCANQGTASNRERGVIPIAAVPSFPVFCDADCVESAVVQLSIVMNLRASANMCENWKMKVKLQRI